MRASETETMAAGRQFEILGGYVCATKRVVESAAVSARHIDVVRSMHEK
jgi:hypothetical protein